MESGKIDIRQLTEEYFATHPDFDTSEFNREINRLHGRFSLKAIRGWRRVLDRRDIVFKHTPGLYTRSIRHSQEKATMITRKFFYVSIFTYKNQF